MTKGKLHAGHRERMRTRFSENGFENYNPHEVLEQVLFLVIPRANTNETAHNLLQRFGSLSGVLNASEEELTEIPGIGSKAASFLASIRGMFLESVEAVYRETGRFDVYELAFLADLMLEPGQGKYLFVVLFGDDQRFLKSCMIRTEFQPDGRIDCTKTAEKMAEIAENRECIAVTADPDMMDADQAANLMRISLELGCPLRQLLLTEDAVLYNLLT